jgi:hypothetical protein
MLYTYVQRFDVTGDRKYFGKWTGLNTDDEVTGGCGAGPARRAPWRRCAGRQRGRPTRCHPFLQHAQEQSILGCLPQGTKVKKVCLILIKKLQILIRKMNLLSLINLSLAHVYCTTTLSNHRLLGLKNSSHKLVAIYAINYFLIYI